MYKTVLAYAGINIKLDLDKICKNTVYKKCYRNLFIFSFNLNLQKEQYLQICAISKLFINCKCIFVTMWNTLFKISDLHTSIKA